MVADNQEAVRNSLKNLETFTASLARNAERVDNVMSRVDGIMGRADSLMLDGRKTLGDISRAVNNFDRNPTRVIFGGGSPSSNAQAAQPAPAATERRR